MPARSQVVNLRTSWSAGGTCVRQRGNDVFGGLEDGDDTVVVRVAGDVAVLSTADFFTPVVDDAFD